MNPFVLQLNLSCNVVAAPATPPDTQQSCRVLFESCMTRWAMDRKCAERMEKLE